MIGVCLLVCRGCHWAADWARVLPAPQLGHTPLTVFLAIRSPKKISFFQVASHFCIFVLGSLFVREAGLVAEGAVSGYHADNIAPAILGGFVMIRYTPRSIGRGCIV